MLMKSRVVPVQRASSRPARGTAVIARSQQHSSAALGALAAAVVLAIGAPAAFADSTEPSTSAASSTVTSISFARVDARVTEKLRERDSNMEWKCKGISMYDCSGELQEAQEQRFEEMGKMFRSLTGGPDTPGNAESQ